MPSNPVSTHAVIDSHLEAFSRKRVDLVLRDYAEGSVLIAPQGTFRGLGEIERFFCEFVGGLPDGFLEAFKMRRQESDGELGHIAWEASPWVEFGTDTFVVRGGKIMMQTFAAFPAPATPWKARVESCR